MYDKTLRLIELLDTTLNLTSIHSQVDGISQQIRLLMTFGSIVASSSSVIRRVLSEIAHVIYEKA